MSNWAQLSFQDAASPIMAQLIAFHDHALLILILVTSIVAYAMLSLTFNSLSSRYLLEAQQIETIWTILPAITLLFLAFPSLHLLYLMDEVSQPGTTIKAIGHQWYWSYEYSDFTKLEFDSYMLPESELTPGEFRLLEVDHRAVVPINTEIRLLITAADVIHSWTVPVLGIKVDAIPGRLNQLGFTADRPGVFYGQCSEICGANHSFMPIALEVVDTKTFINWVLANSTE
uniref:Cytochrome c oxidase subunit 2 n=1 Tax=Melinna cristata TaxID=222004 RepID=A0A8A4VSU5_9ANNE|nr:cytochrome c oxidase subunit II [Melinna cristata]QTD82967.1 cytochrome c oxidase subunit 2 [Melinna cristata]